MNRSVRRALAVAVCALTSVGLLVSASAPASACSCAIASADQQFAAAGAVFTGRLVSTAPAPAAADGSVSSADPTTLLFSVDRVYKGAALALQPVTTSRSEASCGWTPTGEGPYVVYAARGSGTALTTTLCSGSAAGRALPAWGPGAAPTPVPPATTTTGQASQGPAWTAGIRVGGLALVALALVGAAAVVRRRRRVSRP